MTHRDRLLLARAQLARIAEPSLGLSRALAEHGPLDALEQILDGLPSTDADTARPLRVRAEEDLHTADRLGARLIIPEDADWPHRAFAALNTHAADDPSCSGAPLALWARGPGRLSDLAEQSVAVIGARAATSYGERLAAEFATALARAGRAVWSGGSYGVSAAAHRGALAADGPTIAVLACGVDVAHPAGNARLLAQIAERGALLSEQPPGAAPTRERCAARNRLIAATEDTVVIEAGIRSGSLRTARTARALGRPVWAVPGPVTSAQSTGAHDLLRTRIATICTRPEDILRPNR